MEEEFVRQERLWLPELESLSSISCRSVDLPLPSTDPFLSCWRGDTRNHAKPLSAWGAWCLPPGVCLPPSCCRKLLSYQLMEVIADMAHSVTAQLAACNLPGSPCLLPVMVLLSLL